MTPAERRAELRATARTACRDEAFDLDREAEARRTTRTEEPSR